MDALFRLRLLVWVLALGLWAHILYQFISDENPALTEMFSISNPFPRQRLPAPSLIPPSSGAQSPASLNVVSRASMAGAAPFGNFIKPIPLPPSATQQRPPSRPAPEDESIRRHEFGPLEVEQAPVGFSETDTQHFVVYSEGGQPPQDFLTVVENLHANLMLDLAAFSPWANEERVTIYLFRNQGTYHRITGRPAWSGGASSVSKRTLYLYESDEAIGILAHEMTHIYFDGYFLGGHPDPLWLSEGMATVIQVERGLARPNWLPENLAIIHKGGGFRLEDFMRVTNTAGANDDNVRLWYAQAYSVVRYLLRLQGHSSFFHLCQHLREGQPMHAALFRAYGMPFNGAQALEYAWRAHFRIRPPGQPRRHTVILPQPYTD